MSKKIKFYLKRHKTDRCLQILFFIQYKFSNATKISDVYWNSIQVKKNDW